MLKYLRHDDIDLNIQSCRCLICLTYNYEPNRLVILKSNSNISTVLQCFNKMNNELICYVCKLLCNISCNNNDIMSKVKTEKMIIELLIKVFNLPNIEVKKNSLRCILKFGSDSDYDLKVLNENQIVNELINCLKTKDLILLEMVLDCLYRLTYNCIYYHLFMFYFDIDRISILNFDIEAELKYISKSNSGNIKIFADKLVLILYNYK